MKYSCNDCNYVTELKANLSKHLETKKHKINKLTCKQCKKIFTQQSNLIRHKNNICNKQIENNDDEYINDNDTNSNEESKSVSMQLYYDTKIKLIQQEYEIKMLQEKLKDKDSNEEYLKSLVNNAGTLVDKSLTALKYAMKNYSNAPAIEFITDEDITDLMINKLKLGIKIIKDEEKLDATLHEELIYRFRNNKLVEYLGDIIVSHYKKENPENQPLWNSDTSRLNYIIKNLIENEEINDDDNQDYSKWITDKKGVQTVTYVIKPLIEYVKSSILEYSKKLDVESKLSDELKMERIDDCMKILEIIKKGELENNLNKYIAPYFYLNK